MTSKSLKNFTIQSKKLIREKVKSKLVDLIKEEYTNLKELEFPTHQDDVLMQGITFQDLIDVIHSNEREINEKVVDKVFNQMLRDNLRDAQDTLKSKMQFILKNLKRN